MGVPRPWCLLPANQNKPSCRVSSLAILGAPEANRNYRGNPSLVRARWWCASHGHVRASMNPVSMHGVQLTLSPRGWLTQVIHTPADTFVQIDCGKTFREGMVRPSRLTLTLTLLLTLWLDAPCAG
jgi:hypothetical protein